MLAIGLFSMVHYAIFLQSVQIMEDRIMSRNMRRQVVRSRAYRNMRAIQGMSKKETYLRGIGQGIVFLFIGCVILGLNMQKVGNPSLLVDLQAIPAWAQVLGGCSVSFGLCWAIRDACLLISLIKNSEKSSDESTPTV